MDCTTRTAKKNIISIKNTSWHKIDSPIAYGWIYEESKQCQLRLCRVTSSLLWPITAIYHRISAHVECGPPLYFVITLSPRCFFQTIKLRLSYPNNNICLIKSLRLVKYGISRKSFDLVFHEMQFLCTCNLLACRWSKFSRNNYWCIYPSRIVGIRCMGNFLCFSTWTENWKHILIKDRYNSIILLWYNNRKLGQLSYESCSS